KEDEVTVVRGTYKNREGKVHRVYRKKFVINIERLQKEKANGKTHSSLSQSSAAFGNIRELCRAPLALLCARTRVLMCIDAWRLQVPPSTLASTPRRSRSPSSTSTRIART